jgi:hypothetical protein
MGLEVTLFCGCWSGLLVSPALGKVMPTIEAHLRRELHKFAVELRKLAYTVPNGVGEHDLLQLSELMDASADETPKKYLAALPSNSTTTASS